MHDQENGSRHWGDRTIGEHLGIQNLRGSEAAGAILALIGVGIAVSGLVETDGDLGMGEVLVGGGVVVTGAATTGIGRCIRRLRRNASSE